MENQKIGSEPVSLCLRFIIRSGRAPLLNAHVLLGLGIKMSRVIQYAVFLLAALSLTACASSFTATELNDSGYFQTNTLLDKNQVTVSGPFKPEYSKLLYIMSDEEYTQLDDFYFETFSNMGIFQEILVKDDLEELVIRENLSGQVSNISDKIGLYNLAKEIGPFLVVEPNTVWDGGYNYSMTLKAFDASSGLDVLELKNDAFNWSGLDGPLTYPIFNAFLDWARGGEVRVKPATAE